MSSTWPEELNTLFHRLWGKAVSTPEYSKSEWQDLETKIQSLLTTASRLVPPPPLLVPSEFAVGQKAIVATTGNPLNLRTEPSDMASIAALLMNGSSVIIEGPMKNGFYPVMAIRGGMFQPCPDVGGWVRGIFLQSA